jgi:YidC/Oxa1 family membrane protein insertase
MEEDKRNVMIFFAISMLIMIGYPHFFGNQASVIVPKLEQKTDEATAKVMETRRIVRPKAPIQSNAIKNIAIESFSLRGNISSRGAKIDDVKLNGYSKQIESDEKISIFGEKKGNYFAITNWDTDDSKTILPDENTCWKTDSKKLSETSPVIFTWNNGGGLIFEKHISVDEKFLITVVDRVKNYGTKTVVLRSKTKINRTFEKKADDSFSFYEGPLGYLNGKLEEVSYESISKKEEITHDTKGGWFGITDKYWLVAFLPNQNLNYKVLYKHKMGGDKNVYKIEGVDEEISITPSMEVSKIHYLFVGAKEIKTLDMYENKLNVKHFDMAIDFGYLYIMTKPLLYALVYTKDIVGNMGLGILLITLLIKLLLFPLANKSYRSMNRMKDIQPKIQALQKKYTNDKVKLGQEVSEIYKKENINPVGGCFPVLLQSPVLFALYKVLYISIEMRQAPFVLWIHDLSLPDPLAVFNLFGLIPIDLPGFLQIGIWPLLMGLSMLMQQKMGPPPADPSQENVMLIMPIMFTFMLAQLPSGLVIYWTFSNVLSIVQQYMITKMDEKRRLSIKKS